jgi:hypothetical protein
VPTRLDELCLPAEISADFRTSATSSIGQHRFDVDRLAQALGDVVALLGRQRRYLDVDL